MEEMPSERHTPTPWEPLDVNASTSLTGEVPNRFMIGKGGKFVAEFRLEEDRDLAARAVNHYATHDANPDCSCSHVIPEHIDRLVASRDALLEAAKAALDPDPCRYDHNDFCQTHGDDKPCHQEKLRNAIKNAQSEAGGKA